MVTLNFYKVILTFHEPLIEHKLNFNNTNLLVSFNGSFFFAQKTVLTLNEFNHVTLKKRKEMGIRQGYNN